MHGYRSGIYSEGSKETMVTKPKRILVVRTDRLGDVILSTPVIKNLRLYFPEAYIAFMCRPYTLAVVEKNPYLDEVIVYDKHGKHKGFLGSIKFAFYLRNKQFDWAIILHPTNRAHIITFLAGIPFRVGWDKKYPILLNKRIPHYKQEGKKHEVEYTLDLLRSLNIPIKDKELFFPLPEVGREKVDDLLIEEGIKNNDKIILIHPSASCPSRRWPQDNFIRLIEIIKSSIDAAIIIVTVEQEKKFADKIIEKADVIDFRGKLDISELGVLIKRSTLLISNDSGPVHIAASLNTPVISIVGRNNPGLSPVRWQPLGKKSFYFHKDVGCKECLAHNCVRGFICLREITPEEVAKKAILIIG